MDGIDLETMKSCVASSVSFKEVYQKTGIKIYRARNFCKEHGISYNHFIGCVSKGLILNNKYGFLTVLSKTNQKIDGNFLYQCVCDCGNICYKKSKMLRDGKVKSCGCLRKSLIGKNSPVFKGYEGISMSFWKQVLRHANDRNITVSITIEDAWNQFLKQDGKCALTGLTLIFAPKRKLEECGHTTASLDRIDSNKPYDVDNIQWVHKDINRIKWDFPQEQLIQYANMIAKLHPR